MCLSVVFRSILALLALAMTLASVSTASAQEFSPEGLELYEKLYESFFQSDFATFVYGGTVTTDAEAKEEDKPKCPAGFKPAQIIGEWVCVSELKPDDVNPDHQSLRICFDTKDFGRMCVKVKIKCENGTCKITLVPPLIILPNIECEFKPNPSDPAKTIIDCKKVDPIPVIGFPGLPATTLPYRITPDGKFCVTNPAGEEICVEYEAIPGIREIVPKLPGYPTPPPEPVPAPAPFPAANALCYGVVTSD